MVNKIVPIIAAILIVCLGLYELYRSLFKVDEIMESQRKHVEEDLPKGSLIQIGQRAMFESSYGIWIRRGIALFFIIGGTLVLLTQCSS